MMVGLPPDVPVPVQMSLLIVLTIFVALPNIRSEIMLPSAAALPIEAAAALISRCVRLNAER
jgi:hypothetical protein